MIRPRLSFMSGTRLPASSTTSPTPTIMPRNAKLSKKFRTSSTNFANSAPSSRSSVLDVEEEGYGAKLEQLASERTILGLRAAIDNASENCIFFCAAGRVQQLSFSDYYYLNKNESRKERTSFFSIRVSSRSPVECSMWTRRSPRWESWSFTNS